MNPHQDLGRALSLAGEVLRKRMSLDEALLIASATNMLPTLVESLNVLADGPAFAQAELEQRVHSGEAQWALEGRIPRLVLPPELSDWHGESKGVTVDWANASLSQLNGRVTKLLETERDLQDQVEFIKALERHRVTPPTPWLSGVILLGIGLVVSAILAFLVQSPLTALIFFVGFTVAAGLAAIRDMKRYQEFLSKAYREDQQRKARKDQCHKDLETVRGEVGQVIQEAGKIMARLEISGAEEVRRALASYPRLFSVAGVEADKPLI